ncbi:MAG TPA: hypothetical protein VM238_22975 [Phycisphaerae bacterium]|nr:hypothetical protein [Phycisphaerae bacterium]
MRPKPLTLLAAVVIGAAVPLLLAPQEIGYDRTRITPTQATTFQGAYLCIAELSACHGDPAVNKRGYAAIAALPDANCAIWEVPTGANWARWRFGIDADADVATVRAMTARTGVHPGDAMDDFTLAWQWEIVGGTQVQTITDANVYCDTIATTEYSLHAGRTAPTEAEWVAEYEADVKGVRYIAFYRTDEDTDLTVRIEAAYY